MYAINYAPTGKQLSIKCEQKDTKSDKQIETLREKERKREDGRGLGEGENGRKRERERVIEIEKEGIE